MFFILFFNQLFVHEIYCVVIGLIDYLMV